MRDFMPPPKEIYVDTLNVTKRLEEERRQRHEQHIRELQQDADRRMAEMLANDSWISEDSSSNEEDTPKKVRSEIAIKKSKSVFTVN